MNIDQPMREIYGKMHAASVKYLPAYTLDALKGTAFLDAWERWYEWAAINAYLD